MVQRLALIISGLVLVPVLAAPVEAATPRVEVLTEPTGREPSDPGATDPVLRGP